MASKKRKTAGKKAARMRKLRSAGKKAALTRKRKAAGKKAAATRKRKAVVENEIRHEKAAMDVMLDLPLP